MCSDESKGARAFGSVIEGEGGWIIDQRCISDIIAFLSVRPGRMGQGAKNTEMKTNTLDRKLEDISIELEQRTFLKSFDIARRILLMPRRFPLILYREVFVFT